MAKQLLDTAARVKSAGGEQITFDLGEVSITVDQSALASMMEEGPDLVQTFLNNVALRLKGAGIDPSDEVAVKREVERVTFKLIR